MASVKVALQVSLVLLVVVGLLSWVPSASADVCSDTISRLGSCQGYAVGLAGRPPAECCAQVRQLNSQTQGNTPLRRQICGCFQGFIKALGAARFNSLLNACQVALGYTISDTTRCDQIH